ncbi:hypothetical protein A6J40_06830 [Legionella longbeachae]|uniref:Uncharacterized protein n=1 Tax=Legionella longbeachae serogroup 1 (strain NSW150) TaxID=661367 RepID=D3HQS9_LEGLN|nr:hypothetical protein A6J40_06830 [Legionella longbeachae]EEZ95638.1 hypothetical protein LLB_0816 [Legionella longbeachae D-4968]CBJ11249.1 hypothetical protein LLO_0902 [Legionella longbeachae NSW150]ARM34907.1 hypothetical protein B0B39_15890 [Legionella longbeachae]QIN31684.1 hypothetical protein GCB94_05730 [Legionella longbeachae]
MLLHLAFHQFNAIHKGRLKIVAKSLAVACHALFYKPLLKKTDVTPVPISHPKAKLGIRSSHNRMHDYLLYIIY